ncbi:hypothetical protein SNEBB_008233 [Seison nebaliae]|nr:hypothetical protein SNEBB_008233 [Seison nebaliae]
MDHSKMDHSKMNHSMAPMDHLGMDHGTMMGMDHSGMMMYFHTGMNEVILFKWWKTDDHIGIFLFSCFILFVMGFLYEGLKYFREYLYQLDNMNMLSCGRSSQYSLANNNNNNNIDNNNNNNDESSRVQILPSNNHQPNSEQNINNCCSGGDGEKSSPATTTPFIPANNDQIRLDERCHCSTIRKKRQVMMSPLHLYQTILHIVQFVLAYLLMLAFMTYNVWIGMAISLGAGFGYFSFGWRRQVLTQTDNDHCH